MSIERSCKLAISVSCVLFCLAGVAGCRSSGSGPAVSDVQVKAVSVDSIMDAMREAWAGLDTVDSSARMIVTGPNDRIVGDMGMRVQCTRKPRGARWSVGERETTIVDGRLHR